MGFLDALEATYNAFDRFGSKPTGPTWAKTADMHEIANDRERSGDTESASQWRALANQNYLAMLKTEGER